MGVGWTLHSIDDKAIKKVLSRPWTLDKQTFSDRIWTNKQALVNTVNTELTQSIMRGYAPDKAIKTIAERFKVSRSQAGRLIMTESAAFANEARKDCFKDLGVEKYVIVETLDNETCSLCSQLDGKVYPMSEYQVGVTAPPFHPWCRGTTAPYYEDMVGLGDRAARDVKTDESFNIPKDMTYKDWKTQQDATHGAGTVEKARAMSYNEKADRVQFEKYKSRLGADAPKSFAAFQQLKYNSEDYKDLTGYYRYKGANSTSDKRFWTAHKAVKALHDEGKVRTTGTLVAPTLGRVAIKANKHAEKRFTSRGITLEWTQNIIDNADFALKQRKGTQYAFYTSEGFAVLDNNGEIGTAGQLDERGKLLYDEVMKHVRAK